MEEGDGGVEYYTEKSIRFASPYVGDMVTKRLEQIMRLKVCKELDTVLKRGGKSNQYWGYCFESIAHRILRDDGDFKTRSLDTEEEYIYTTFHQEEILTFSEVATIENYKYYQPLSENFPSFDSIHAPTSLFQMTTSLIQPITMNGLYN